MTSSPELTIEALRDIVQGAHLNFLLGAGASAPLMRPLGSIEVWLEELAANSTADRDQVLLARASLYAYYFEGAIAPNSLLLSEDPAAESVLSTYRKFLRTLNTLLVRRRSSLIDKQVNLFTTNVDIAVEVASEQLQIDLNDGFAGKYLPLFSTSNFGTVRYRRTVQYDNLSEVATINLLKLHGSVNWRSRSIQVGEESRVGITFTKDASLINSLQKLLDDPALDVYEIDDDIDVSNLIDGEPLDDGQLELLEQFVGEYESLAMVNPTKEKFGLTVLNQNYYDLLRLFSNSLEKENSVLFVLGFSCRDEHIRELIMRAARTNPTLQIIVFAHLPHEVQSLKDRLGVDLASNGNISVLGPPVAEEGEEQAAYTLETVTSTFFEPMLPTPPRRPDSVVDIRLTLAEPGDDES